jgi:ParB family chromosome partitioning protein
MNKSMGRGDANDNLSFASETSKATGRDRRTIERAAARGAALGDDLVDIAGTSLDKGVELDALAKTPEDERKALIERAKAGEKVSARAARRRTA